MRSIATLVAVLLCAAGGYLALQAALPPTEYPTPGELDDAEQRRPETPQLQERPDPIEFKWTLKPPEDVMAARTAVEMGTTWNATLDVANQSARQSLSEAPTDSVTFGALGGYASVVNKCQVPDCGHNWDTECHQGPPRQHASNDPAPEGWQGSEFGYWAGVYWPFVVTAQVGYDVESAQIWVWFEDWYVDPPFSMPGIDSGTVYEDTASIETAIVVSGLYLKCGRTSNPPDDRQLMDFTDQTGADVWYADSETTVTVTCGPCSAQGSLTYSDEEVEIGSNFALGTSMTLNSAPTAETVYARISDIKWGDTLVGGDGVYLYNPGDTGDIPNSTVAPGWSRTKTTDNCARALAGSTQELCHLQGTTSQVVFSTQSWAPYILTLTPLDGKFSAEGPAYDINYTSNPVTWDSETETYVPDVFSTHYGPIVQATLSWLYEWEWRKLSSTSIQVRVDQDWREANNENVGGETETQNDQRAGLCMWPLTAADRTSAPWWSSGFGAAHLSSIDINDTYGLPSRASPWTAGAGVTVDPGDNDTWTVTAGASAPAVSRSLLTRYWLRMDRLADHLDDPEAEHNPDWPIMLKANLPITTTLDDPDWWSSAAGGVDAEDITNWAEFSYLRLGITAPRTGTVRLVVDYSVPSVYDPCYTDFTHRFGAEGEWSYTRTRKQVSYDIAVSPGANTALIDLMLPNEHLFPVEGARIQVVDKLTMQLVGNDGDDAEEWTLTELVLVLDPGEGTRTEPVHIEARFKPSWAWGSNWFGFGCVVDGKPSLCYDYGYSSYRGKEWGPLYIGHRQHNPESALTDRLDYAKPLATLCGELGYQEGWVTTWPDPTPEESANNMDADDDQVDSSLYWWDIKQSTIDITLSDLEVALCCGTYTIAAGVPYDLRYYKYPRGAVHGILLSGDWAGRVRDAVAAVEIWDASDGAWTLIDTVDTDEHGRFAYLGLRELGGPYRIGQDGNALTVINRSYTFDRLLVAISYEPYIDVDECGLTWLVTESDGALRVYYLDARESPEQMEVAQPTALTGYSRPSIAVRGGELLVAATDAGAGNTLLWSSFDRGETWSEVATDLGDGITLGTVSVRPGTGEVILTGIDSSDNVVLRMASDTDLPRDYLTAGVDEITITAAAEGARSTCQAHPDGSLIAAVEGVAGVDFFRCRCLADGFAAV